MTERERDVYADLRDHVYYRANGVCEAEGCSNPLIGGPQGPWQIAHVLPQDTVNLKKYGKKIIHHRLNVKGTCSGACNAAVSMRNHPVAERELVEAIERELSV